MCRRLYIEVRTILLRCFVLLTTLLYFIFRRHGRAFKNTNSKCERPRVFWLKSKVKPVDGARFGIFEARGTRHERNRPVITDC